MSDIEPTAPADPRPVPATAGARLPAQRSAALAPLKALLGTALTRSVPMALYQMNRIGRAGAAGAAMLLFAVIFFFSAILPQQRELLSLDQRIKQAHHLNGAADSAPVKLNRFMNALPKRGDLPNLVGQVFTIAAASGVILDRGRYEMVPMRAGHLAQYRMTFPVKGHYPEIRKFIDAVLTAIPSVAVEGMRIERKAVGEENVAADLRFSIFVRNDS
jgi:hypothetical protein